MKKGEIAQIEQFHLFPQWFLCEKGDIAQIEQISPFSTMFSMQSVSWNHLIATSQLSSAASLNLGRSQNGVLGNGLRRKSIDANGLQHAERDITTFTLSFVSDQFGQVHLKPHFPF